MAEQLQFRRDVTAVLGGSAWPEGEPHYDTVRGGLIVGDGATAGGVIIPTHRELLAQTWMAANAVPNGGVNVLQVTLAGTAGQRPTAPVNFMRLCIAVSAANTGAVTLQLVGGGGAMPVRRADGTTELAAGELPANRPRYLTYYGGVWHLDGGGGAGGGGIVRRLTYAATASYVKSPGIRFVHVLGEGGGGGGGGRYPTGGQGGGGGGAGGPIDAWLDAAAVPSSLTVTIGAAAGLTAAGQHGASGGTTSFGTLVSGTGGGGGLWDGTGGVGGIGSGAGLSDRRGASGGHISGIRGGPGGAGMRGRSGGDGRDKDNAGGSPGAAGWAIVTEYA